MSFLRGTPATAFSIHSTIRPILDKYDGFILDQFGVLHNGSEPLNDVLDCLEYISQQPKKKMVVLSNTSSPESTCLKKLKRMGFDDTSKWFSCGAITSGEEAARYIKSTYGSNKNDKPSNALWLTYTQDVDDNQTKKNDDQYRPPAYEYLDACGDNIKVATSVSDADFIIAHGSQIWYKSFHEQVLLGSFMNDGILEEDTTPMASLLDECAQRSLPFICANPDLTVKVKDGRKLYMPGLLAKYYRKALMRRNNQDSSNDDNEDTKKKTPSSPDNLVLEFGKPHVEHFEACIKRLHPISRDRICMIGDSLHHDTKGAQDAGIDSVLVASYAGVHAEELGLVKNDDDETITLPSKEGLLQALFLKTGITPTHVIPSFCI